MEAMVIDVMRETMMAILIAASPLLIVALIVGLSVSIFQTATSIQEQSLSFILKIVSIFAALILFGPWMITTLTNFFVNLVSQFSTMIG
ncbi:MAG: flagellar biosynthetic protein FliQ [Epulopiscium sp. Nuni2H_MBin003]|nr:MAG: flagellar biosynthetic protein FliQ [Epulopiscium sp. Nuni2H_MBin003]